MLIKYFPRKEFSEWENRKLTLMPSLFINQRLNENFSKNIENYIKDQFPFREQIIKTQFQVMSKINGRVENNKAFMLDNGWVFEKRGTVTYYTQMEMENRLRKLKRSLIALHMIMRRKNLSIVFLLLPDKGWLYKDMWEPYYKPYNLEPFYQAEINAIKKYQDIEIIYPYKKLKNMGLDNPPFLTDDLHLSFTGAKFVLQLAFDKFQKQYFPKEEIQYEITSDTQDVVSKLGFDRKTIKESYKLIATILNKTIKSHETILLEEKEAIKKTEVTDPLVNKNMYIYDGCYSRRTFYPLLRHFFKKTIAFSSYDYLSEETRKNFVVKFHDALKNIESDSIIFVVMPLNYNNTFIYLLSDSLLGL